MRGYKKGRHTSSSPTNVKFMSDVCGGLTPSEHDRCAKFAAESSYAHTKDTHTDGERKRAGANKRENERKQEENQT